MAQQPSDPGTGPVAEDEQTGSRGPCHPSYQISRAENSSGEPLSQQHRQQQQQQQREEVAPDSAAAAPAPAADVPCIAPTAGSADPVPGWSLSITYPQQQQQQQQQQKTPDCVGHARSELQPAKLSAPPSIAVRSTDGDGGRGTRGIGIEIGSSSSIDKTGDNTGQGGGGHNSSPCFNTIGGLGGGGIHHDGGSGPIISGAAAMDVCVDINTPPRSGARGAGGEDKGDGSVAGRGEVEDGDDEEEEEQKEDMNVATTVNSAFLPAYVPPGSNLDVTPWCCGSDARAALGKRGEPRLVCNTPRCKKWMCHACRVDKTCGNGCSTFVCCDCELVYGPCLCHRCQLRKSRIEQQAADLASGVRSPAASESATSVEAPSRDAFRFPPIGPTGNVELFSVSTAATNKRVFVMFQDVKIHDKRTRLITCTDKECMSIGSAVREAILSGEESVLNGRCKHAMVVLESGGKSFRQDTPEASPVNLGEEEGVVGLARILAGTGRLGNSDVKQIQELSKDAVSCGSPLVVKLGATGVFAVHDRLNRFVPGGWAHVRARGMEAKKIGAEEAVSGRGRGGTTGSAKFQCEGGGGDPCGMPGVCGASLEICPHAHIVGLTLLREQYDNDKDAQPLNSDEDEDLIDVNGKEMASARAQWRDGDGGVGGGGGRGGGDGNGRSEFTGKILHLLKVMGVVKFPMNPTSHLSDHARKTVLEGDGLIPCHESVCSYCGGGLLVTEHKEGIALAQRFAVIPVRIERKKCAACGVAAVAGDDWREHGYFVFGAYAAHLAVLITVRNFVSSGMSITTAWSSLLEKLWDDFVWLGEYPELAKKVVDNNDFLYALLQLYLAFEALTDRPYNFSSVVHGFFPQPDTSRGNGGGNKLAQNDGTLEAFLAQGEEIVVDVDLSACWLVLSMLSPLVFSKRLRFVYTPPMAFCPFSRKSNLFVLKAKGGRREPVVEPPARLQAKGEPERGAVDTPSARLQAKGGPEGAAVETPPPQALPSTSATGEGNSGDNECGHPPPETVCTQQDNVYAVWRLATVNPPVQRGTDFVCLFNMTARKVGDVHAAEFASVAHRNVHELRRLGRYSVDLFEVVAVLNARLTTYLAEEAELQGEGGTDAEELSVLVAFREFSSGVLAVAVGSTTGEVPALPAFFRDLPKAEVGVIGDVTSVAAMVLYAEAKEEFIATKLRPVDSRRRALAVQALRSGAPFGAAVYRPKALQIWASHGNPDFLANKEDKQVDGFDTSFNVGPPEDRFQTTQRVPRRSLGGAFGGACFDRDGAIEERCPSDHGGDLGRRRKLDELDARLDQQQLLRGVKQLNSCRQRQRQKTNYAKNSSETFEEVLGELDFDRLAFMGTLVNDVESEKANRRSLEDMVEDVDENQHAFSIPCQMSVCLLGRCWCELPLVRLYDGFDRAYLSFLE